MKKNNWIFILVTVILFSCHKEDDLLKKENVEVDLQSQTDPNWANAKQTMLKSSSGKKNQYLKSEHNRFLEELAFSTVKALEKVEFRKLLKEKALEQFDGDYDVLFEQLLNEKLPDSKSVDEYLKEKGKIQTIDALKNKKNIQISIPENCEDWDVINSIPLVTFIPDGYDEHLYDSVKAFKSDGSVVWISSVKPPKEPVVVIGYSERIGNDGEIKDFIKLENVVSTLKSAGETAPATPSNLTITNYQDFELYLSWQDNSSDETGFKIYTRSQNTNWNWVLDNWCSSNTGIVGANNNDYISEFWCGNYNGLHYFKVNAYNSYGSSSYSNTVSSCVSQWRYAGMTEQLQCMKFTDIQSVEGWLQGKPELYLAVYSQTGTKLHEARKAPKRSDIENKWYYWRHNMFTWYPDQIGRVITVQWVEEDGGSSTTISVPIYNEAGQQTMTVSQTVKDDDDPMGAKAIFWCDLSVENDIGMFRWVHWKP